MARPAEGSQSLEIVLGVTTARRSPRLTPGDVSGCPAVKALTSATGLLKLNVGRIAARLH